MPHGKSGRTRLVAVRLPNELYAELVRKSRDCNHVDCLSAYIVDRLEFAVLGRPGSWWEADEKLNLKWRKF